MVAVADLEEDAEDPEQADRDAVAPPPQQPPVLSTDRSADVPSRAAS